eukprot:m.107178 g.107178  ORF g.107178 m.107178 type:complete len:446 (-) comp15307_c0_seq2:124-1461(-)
MAFNWNSPAFYGSAAFAPDSGSMQAITTTDSQSSAFGFNQSMVHPGPPPTSLNSAWLAANTASLLPSVPAMNHDIVASLNQGLNASNLTVLQQQQEQLAQSQHAMTWNTSAARAAASNFNPSRPAPQNGNIPFGSLQHEWVGLDFQTPTTPPALPTSGHVPTLSAAPTVPTTLDDTAGLGQLLRESITDELAFEALQPMPSDVEPSVFTGRSSSRQSSEFFLPDSNVRSASQQSGSPNSQSTRPHGQSVVDSGLSIQDDQFDDGKSSSNGSRFNRRPPRLSSTSLQAAERLRETIASDEDLENDDSASVESSSSEEYIAPRRGRRPSSNRNGKRAKGKGAARASGSKSAKRSLVGEDSSGSLPCNKRFPTTSTQVLKAWLYEHTLTPYPSEEVKKELMQQSGLSLAQLNNWFINARRRLLDKGKGSGKGKRKAEFKTKTSKASTR